MKNRPFEDYEEVQLQIKENTSIKYDNQAMFLADLLTSIDLDEMINLNLTLENYLSERKTDASYNEAVALDSFDLDDMEIDIHSFGSSEAKEIQQGGIILGYFHSGSMDEWTILPEAQWKEFLNFADEKTREFVEEHKKEPFEIYTDASPVEVKVEPVYYGENATRYNLEYRFPGRYNQPLYLQYSTLDMSNEEIAVKALDHFRENFDEEARNVTDLEDSDYTDYDEEFWQTSLILAEYDYNNNPTDRNVENSFLDRIENSLKIATNVLTSSAKNNLKRSRFTEDDKWEMDDDYRNVSNILDDFYSNYFTSNLAFESEIENFINEQLKQLKTSNENVFGMFDKEYFVGKTDEEIKTEFENLFWEAQSWENEYKSIKFIEQLDALLPNLDLGNKLEAINNLDDWVLSLSQFDEYDR